MSQLSARSEIFLGEMGIGLQWKLRNPPAVEEAAPGVEQPAVIEAEIAAPQPVVAAIQSMIETPVLEPVEVVVPAAQPAAAAQATAAAQTAAAVQSAASVEAVVPPMSASGAALSEDTAWFDDAPEPAPQAPANEAANEAANKSAPAGRQAPISEQAIAGMDWSALQAAVASCTRCGLCATRRNAVPGRGARDASWLAIAAAPTQADEDAVRAISGEAGQLLDNMLKAISLSTESNAYVTTLVKCRPQSGMPTAEEVLACRPFLEREMALTGAGMALTFGQAAAKGLLGVASRGKVHRYGTLPVVATYHPDDLLRKPEDKAKAWADLCLARDSRD